LKIPRENLAKGFSAIKLPLMILLVSAFAILFVWQRAYTLSLSRQIVSLQTQLRNLRVQNSTMERQLSSLYSPDRIESLADELCGLRYSRPEQKIYVAENKQIPRINSRWRKSLFAVRRYFSEKWAYITGKRRPEKSLIGAGNL